MEDTAVKRCGYVVGPDGLVLTPSNLPQPGRIRWVARRKAELVAAVSGGLLSMQEACQRYAISTEEFTDWERRYMRRGLQGLRVSVRSDDADKINESPAQH
jgi:transposase-like protein